MNENFHQFPDVTLLITHYNRSQSLEHLLETFRRQQCFFVETVVSDDGSTAPHQEHLKHLQSQYGFRLITTPQNRGLGHNLNKGQDAVRTPYTLYIQEDFEPEPAFAPNLAQALTFMQADRTIDIARFYAYTRYPHLTPYGGGFSEMRFSPWSTAYEKIYCYSDHPHLRRSTFFDRFGRYAEGIKGDKMEYKMCISFIQQRGRGLFFENYQGLFRQINTATEPSTMQRSAWTQSRQPVIALIRDVYRQIKYNFDIQFKRVKIRSLAGKELTSSQPMIHNSTP
ncbi:MAG: glycosyltransferase [Cytophagaceae bacterium]|nr:glycosyltransferase [Cytophagaceae bacterium]